MREDSSQAQLFNGIGVASNSAGGTARAWNGRAGGAQFFPQTPPTVGPVQWAGQPKV